MLEDGGGRDVSIALFSTRLLRSVTVAPVTAGSLGGTTFKNLPAIRFLPDGTIDENSPKTVQLKQDSQEMWLVELQNRTGYEVSDSPK